MGCMTSTHGHEPERSKPMRPNLDAKHRPEEVYHNALSEVDFGVTAPKIEIDEFHPDDAHLDFTARRTQKRKDYVSHKPAPILPAPKGLDGVDGDAELEPEREIQELKPEDEVQLEVLDPHEGQANDLEKEDLLYCIEELSDKVQRLEGLLDEKNQELLKLEKSPSRPARDEEKDGKHDNYHPETYHPPTKTMLALLEEQKKMEEENEPLEPYDPAYETLLQNQRKPSMPDMPPPHLREDQSDNEIEGEEVGRKDTENVSPNPSPTPGVQDLYHPQLDRPKIQRQKGGRFMRRKSRKNLLQRYAIRRKEEKVQIWTTDEKTPQKEKYDAKIKEYQRNLALAQSDTPESKHENEETEGTYLQSVNPNIQSLQTQLNTLPKIRFPPHGSGNLALSGTGDKTHAKVDPKEDVGVEARDGAEKTRISAISENTPIGDFYSQVPRPTPGGRNHFMMRIDPPTRHVRSQSNATDDLNYSSKTASEIESIKRRHLTAIRGRPPSNITDDTSTQGSRSDQFFDTKPHIIESTPKVRGGDAETEILSYSHDGNSESRRASGTGVETDPKGGGGVTVDTDDGMADDDDNTIEFGASDTEGEEEEVCGINSAMNSTKANRNSRPQTLSSLKGCDSEDLSYPIADRKHEIHTNENNPLAETNVSNTTDSTVEFKSHRDILWHEKHQQARLKAIARLDEQLRTGHPPKRIPPTLPRRVSIASQAPPVPPRDGINPDADTIKSRRKKGEPSAAIAEYMAQQFVEEQARKRQEAARMRYLHNQDQLRQHTLLTPVDTNRGMRRGATNSSRRPMGKPPRHVSPKSRHVSPQSPSPLRRRPDENDGINHVPIHLRGSEPCRCKSCRSGGRRSRRTPPKKSYE
ncbi:hypothetical protein AAMO2058_000574400 [Amorphochlora amoebiformis]